MASRVRGTVRRLFEGRPPRVLFNALVLAVVVSLLAGFALGFAVERSRVHKTAAAKQVGTRPHTTTSRPKRAAPALRPPLVGRVYRVQGTQLWVVTAQRKVVRLVMNRSLRSVLAATRQPDSSGLVAGTRVLFHRKPGSTAGAVSTDEILLLPKGTPLGLKVSAVTRGSQMTFTSKKGPVNISTTGAVYDKATAVTRVGITLGAHVIVRVYRPRPRGKAFALAVIVLPSDTLFR